MNIWVLVSIVLAVVCLCIILMGQHKKKKMENNIKELVGYNLEDSAKIMGSLKGQPIEEVSKYADKVCKENSSNVDFLKQQFSDPDNMYKTIEESLKGKPDNNQILNPTSIGNSAFIALNAPTPYNEHGKKTFELLMSYVK